MTATETIERSAEHVFAEWTAELDDAFAAGDPRAIAELIDVDGYWRDILAFSWGYRTFECRDRIVAALREHLAASGARSFRPSASRTAPRRVRRSSMPLIEAYFDFETAVGTGTGFVRLHDEPGERPRAWIMLTTLHSIHGYEERLGSRRPHGEEFARDVPGQNWLDHRQREIAFADRDPEVLVVGGGQGGLMLAARLRQMGVDLLVVERSEQVGDNWRNRYHSLTLHNETWGNSLPYLPFPGTWPRFLPKDKLAGWLQYYVEAMEINLWTSTTFLGAERNDDDTLWRARLRLGDGSERILEVPHIVFATGGHSGVPYRPNIPGLDQFRGRVMHSSEYANGAVFRDAKVVVFGTGNSAHDIAQDLHANGAASVTMVQSGATCVVSLEPCGVMVYSIYSEGPPAEDVDLITAAIPYPVLRDTYQHLTRRTCELDKDLIDGLEARGFRTTFEPDGTGFHMRYLRSGGGYYINVGCSNLIIDGSIGVEQLDDIECVMPEGIRLRDGELLEADLIVLATGYANQQEGVRLLLGDDVADKVGPIWGFDENQTMRNTWQRTAQRGFWVTGGALMEARFHSRPLALQILAELRGVRHGGAPAG